VKWSKIPNLYSTTLASGKVQLNSLNSEDISSAPPKWYCPPVGCHISPNFNIVNFTENEQANINISKINK
jgi:hypothetical protein